jgi:hypothetical protein
LVLNNEVYFISSDPNMKTTFLFVTDVSRVRVRYDYLVRADVKINWTGGNDVLNIKGGMTWREEVRL